jgi:LmbE family N-acetylglucosaminyl deacetylase
LYKSLTSTAEHLRSTINSKNPDFILTHAFEHGHPDHDCCSFLAAQLGREFGKPVWEMPIYGRSKDGGELVQRFEDETGISQIIPNHEQIALKQSMLNAHKSQVLLGNLKKFHADLPESFRPQPNYSFTDPPNWTYLVETATPEELRQAFQTFIDANSEEDNE